MPSIGARFYTQLDSAYLWGDMVEGELEKESIKSFQKFQNFVHNIFRQNFMWTFFQEVENGRLFRLLCKLGSVNERPHSGNVAINGENGDKFLVRMFRTYLFRQSQEGHNWLELSHIVAALNKVSDSYWWRHDDAR